MIALRNTNTGMHRGGRVLAGLLALVWIGLGLAVIWAAASSGRWLVGALIGMPAIAYGLVWIRVVRLGRRLSLREAWMALQPWRSDPGR